MARDECGAPGGLAERKIGRRGLLTASTGILTIGLAQPLATFPRLVSPEADPEPDPEPQPETGTEGGEFTLYSGRNETLIRPLVERYAEETGRAVKVRYGGTGELAATILEEGNDTPAGAFLAQDAGALGLLADQDRFAPLAAELLELVDARFRDPRGRWVGVTGRARVLAYNTEAVSEEDLPASVRELTNPFWAARIGWAPENASFHSFITAFRSSDGDDAVRSWLGAMIANGAVNFGDSNASIVQAIGNGEIDAGLVNHYYVYVVGREAGGDFPVANHYFAAGDPGALINVSGIGSIEGAANPEAVLSFAEYLLSATGQQYFANETYEYPLVEGIAAPVGLPPLSEIGRPDLDLGDLADLRGTLDLLAEVGLL